MSRIPFAAVIAVLLIAFTATTADARRGFRIPIVVPGIGGGSESIEKVLDLPDIPALRREDGTYIDLGYLHKGGGNGEWVGYVGTSKTYLVLSESKLKMLLMVAGVPELPPVPERKGSPGEGSTMWVVLALVMFGGGWKLLKGLTGGAASAAAGTVQRVARSVSDQASGESDWSKAHEAIAKAAERRAMVSGAGAARSAAPRQTAAQGIRDARMGGLQTAAAGGFGRRGR